MAKELLVEVREYYIPYTNREELRDFFQRMLLLNADHLDEDEMEAMLDAIAEEDYSFYLPRGDGYLYFKCNGVRLLIPKDAIILELEEVKFR